MSAKIHILFHTSAVGTLKQVLRKEGQREQAICLWDDLSYGGIASLDPETRDRVLRDAGITERIDPMSSAQFWKRCADTKRNRVLWVAPRSPAEMSGFLAYMHRFGHIPCRLISMNEVRGVVRLKNDEPRETLFCSGVLSPENICAAMARARPFLADEASFAARLWEQLVQENTMLRVPGGPGLISVPETFVDECIVSKCPERWIRTIRLLGEVVGRLPDEQGLMLSDIFLSWRIQRLVGKGALETRADNTNPSLRFSGKELIRRPV